MTNDLRHVIQHYLTGRHDTDGSAVSPFPGLALMRTNLPGGITRAIYRPVLCLVLQGVKQVTVGKNTYEFAAGQSALISADVSVISRVSLASPAAPYLAVAIELDPLVLLDLLSQAGDLAAAGSPTPAAPAVLVDQTDDAVADCALRLMRLTERPAAIPVLRPAIMRELHYWLLAGRHGCDIRNFACPSGVSQRIARVVAVLRTEMSRPLKIDELASIAGMSSSTFHHHFRAVTSLSPLQFQKQLRLIEARRQMLSDGTSLSGAAFAVGYESVSQFTREYGRMFGVPPGRDARLSRAA